MATVSTSVSIGMTSPSSATTTTGTSSGDISSYDHAIVHAVIQGGTGGTLDVYIQTLVGTTEWVDVAHFTQLASGGTQVGATFSLSRYTGTGGTAPIAVNKVADTPVLAAGAYIPGLLGTALRTVCVAGTSTSAGAAQTITVQLFGRP